MTFNVIFTPGFRGFFSFLVISFFFKKSPITCISYQFMENSRFLFNDKLYLKSVKIELSCDIKSLLSNNSVDKSLKISSYNF